MDGNGVADFELRLPGGALDRFEVNVVHWILLSFREPGFEGLAPGGARYRPSFALARSFRFNAGISLTLGGNT